MAEKVSRQEAKGIEKALYDFDGVTKVTHFDGRTFDVSFEENQIKTGKLITMMKYNDFEVSIVNFNNEKISFKLNR